MSHVLPIQLIYVRRVNTFKHFKKTDGLLCVPVYSDAEAARINAESLRNRLGLVLSAYRLRLPAHLTESVGLSEVDIELILKYINMVMYHHYDRLYPPECVLTRHYKPPPLMPSADDSQQLHSLTSSQTTPNASSKKKGVTGTATSNTNKAGSSSTPKGKGNSGTKGNGKNPPNKATEGNKRKREPDTESESDSSSDSYSDEDVHGTDSESETNTHRDVVSSSLTVSTSRDLFSSVRTISLATQRAQREKGEGRMARPPLGAIVKSFERVFEGGEIQDIVDKLFAVFLTRDRERNRMRERDTVEPSQSQSQSEVAGVSMTASQRERESEAELLLSFSHSLTQLSQTVPPPIATTQSQSQLPQSQSQSLLLSQAQSQSVTKREPRGRTLAFPGFSVSLSIAAPTPIPEERGTRARTTSRKRQHRGPSTPSESVPPPPLTVNTVFQPNRSVLYFHTMENLRTFVSPTAKPYRDRQPVKQPTAPLTTDLVSLSDPRVSLSLAIPEARISVTARDKRTDGHTVNAQVYQARLRAYIEAAGLSPSLKPYRVTGNSLGVQFPWLRDEILFTLSRIYSAMSPSLLSLSGGGTPDDLRHAFEAQGILSTKVTDEPTPTHVNGERGKGRGTAASTAVTDKVNVCKLWWERERDNEGLDPSKLMLALHFLRSLSLPENYKLSQSVQSMLYLIDLIPTNLHGFHRDTVAVADWNYGDLSFPRTHTLTDSEAIADRNTLALLGQDYIGASLHAIHGGGREEELLSAPSLRRHRIAQLIAESASLQMYRNNPLRRECPDDSFVPLDSRDPAPGTLVIAIERDAESEGEREKETGKDGEDNQTNGDGLRNIVRTTRIVRREYPRRRTTRSQYLSHAKTAGEILNTTYTSSKPFKIVRGVTQGESDGERERETEMSVEVKEERDEEDEEMEVEDGTHNIEGSSSSGVRASTTASTTEETAEGEAEDVLGGGEVDEEAAVGGGVVHIVPDNQMTSGKGGNRLFGQHPVRNTPGPHSVGHTVAAAASNALRVRTHVHETLDGSSRGGGKLKYRMDVHGYVGDHKGGEPSGKKGDRHRVDKIVGGLTALGTNKLFGAHPLAVERKVVFNFPLTMPVDARTGQVEGVSLSPCDIASLTTNAKFSLSPCGKETTVYVRTSMPNTDYTGVPLCHTHSYSHDHNLSITHCANDTPVDLLPDPELVKFIQVLAMEKLSTCIAAPGNQKGEIGSENNPIGLTNPMAALFQCKMDETAAVAIAVIVEEIARETGKCWRDAARILLPYGEREGDGELERLPGETERRRQVFERELRAQIHVQLSGTSLTGLNCDDLVALMVNRMEFMFAKQFSDEEVSVVQDEVVTLIASQTLAQTLPREDPATLMAPVYPLRPCDPSHAAFTLQDSVYGSNIGVYGSEGTVLSTDARTSAFYKASVHDPGFAIDRMTVNQHPYGDRDAYRASFYERESEKYAPMRELRRIYSQGRESGGESVDEDGPTHNRLTAEEREAWKAVTAEAQTVRESLRGEARDKLRVKREKRRERDSDSDADSDSERVDTRKQRPCVRPETDRWGNPIGVVRTTMDRSRSRLNTSAHHYFDPNRVDPPGPKTVQAAMNAALGAGKRDDKTRTTSLLHCSSVSAPVRAENVQYLPLSKILSRRRISSLSVPHSTTVATSNTAYSGKRSARRRRKQALASSTSEEGVNDSDDTTDDATAIGTASASDDRGRESRKRALETALSLAVDPAASSGSSAEEGVEVGEEEVFEPIVKRVRPVRVRKSLLPSLAEEVVLGTPADSSSDRGSDERGSNCEDEVEGEKRDKEAYSPKNSQKMVTVCEEELYESSGSEYEDDENDDDVSSNEDD